jgi:hypothetical protein
VDEETKRLAAILDFGDASIGPAEMDFFYTWLRWWDRREDVDAVVEGYIAEADPGPEFHDTLRFMRIVAAMRCDSDDGAMLDVALAEVEALAHGTVTS